MNFAMSPNLLNDWTVLVVDDEPDSIEVVRTLLELCGARVITADNGETGFIEAKQNRPDFIISDLSMPGVSGWEMLERLKTELSTQQIPIIALTAHAMDGDRNRAIAAGFHNYLSKPLEPETFVSDLLGLLVDVPNIAKLLNREQG